MVMIDNFIKLAVVDGTKVSPTLVKHWCQTLEVLITIETKPIEGIAKQYTVLLGGTIVVHWHRALKELWRAIRGFVVMVHGLPFQ
jgi:hypothetical protein